MLFPWVMRQPKYHRCSFNANGSIITVASNKLESGHQVCYKRENFVLYQSHKDTSRQAWRQGMSNPTLVMYEEEFQEVNDVIERLLKEANAKVIFLVDKNGQLISGVGETERFDTTSLASLTAGNIAATGGLAKLIGEKEFSILFHEGEKDNLHISIVGGRVILVVLFDNRSSLGLVRLRVKKTSEELSGIFERLMRKSEEREKRGSSDFPFAEITDEDIDNLFG
jgi:predicted regulator of Ras-like GTPase activity (Roadblock/LC7/MglB family)